MSNLMKTLTIGNASYEVCDANARETLESKASYADMNAAVKKAAPRNLLDNSDFTNPVNQRGKTIYNGAGVSIDRWKAFHTDTIHEVITGQGVKASGSSPNMYQVINLNEIDTSRVMTAACCDVDNNIFIWSGIPSATAQNPVCVYLSGASCLFRLSAVKTWKWAALYYGEYTIDTLPEYQPKGYGQELAECQRYTIKLGGVMRYKACQFTSSLIDFVIPLPVTMRVIPSVESGTINVMSSGATITDFVSTIHELQPNGIVVRATKSGHGLDFLTTMLDLDDLILSANL